MSPAEFFGLSELGQIALTVGDLPRAVAFYRDALGMKFLFEAPPRMAFFDCGGIRLLLGERPASAASIGQSSSVLYYRVKDIHAAYEALVGRGVTFDEKPHLVARLPDREVWLAEFHDPDRNALALLSEVPRG